MRPAPPPCSTDSQLSTDVVAAYPDTAIHVVLDNLSTHKPKNDRWLKRHPNMQFHFTPTRASWLTAVGDLIHFIEAHRQEYPR